jgi:prepilin-type N-terminal cleavage/methylation domain-containing protein
MAYAYNAGYTFASRGSRRKMTRGEHGFTLLELALVLLVVGVLTAGSVALMSSSSSQIQTAAQNARVSSLEAAVLEFALAQRRLPCPSDGDGAEDCSAGHTSGYVPYLTLGMSVPPVNSSSPAIRYAVFRDATNADLSAPLTTAGSLESTITSAGAVTDGTAEFVSGLQWAGTQSVTQNQPFVTSAGGGCGSPVSNVAFALSSSQPNGSGLCFSQSDTWVGVDAMLVFAYQNAM